MPLAITLSLDPTTTASVQRIWCALARQTGDDDALRLGYAPHLTLAVVADAEASADIERLVFAAIGSWDALPLTLAGFGVFPAPSPVLWLAPVVTRRLLARHQALCTALAPHTIDPHYRPGAWVPHVTLSQGVRTIAAAIEAVSSVWCGPIQGHAAQVDLVRFHPVEILSSAPLRC